MRIFYRALLLLLLAGGASCGNDSIVEQFMDAYNNHSVDAMLELTTDDVRWMSVAGDKISIEADGKVALRSAMTDFFANRLHARSRHRSIKRSSSFVYTLAEAYAASGERQCSVSIYELQRNKIANVWYFAAQQCPRNRTQYAFA